MMHHLLTFVCIVAGITVSASAQVSAKRCRQAFCTDGFCRNCQGGKGDESVDQVEESVNEEQPVEEPREVGIMRRDSPTIPAMSTLTYYVTAPADLYGNDEVDDEVGEEDISNSGPEKRLEKRRPVFPASGLNTLSRRQGGEWAKREIIEEDEVDDGIDDGVDDEVDDGVDDEVDDGVDDADVDDGDGDDGDGDDEVDDEVDDGVDDEVDDEVDEEDIFNSGPKKRLEKRRPVFPASDGEWEKREIIEEDEVDDGVDDGVDDEVDDGDVDDGVDDGVDDVDIGDYTIDDTDLGMFDTTPAGPDEKYESRDVKFGRARREPNEPEEPMSADGTGLGTI
ncbi:hypothetical protein Btru_014884 [Bulinus truncatus]|nr:hypothetical protein Btru_014884 [Bulinus truncatus]